MRKVLAFFLAAALVFSLSACGKTPDTLGARFQALYLTDFPQEYLDAPDDYADEIAGFGLDDFAEAFADPTAFRCYNAEIAVSNANDYAVQILGLKADSKNNGKNGVYFSVYDGGVSLGLPARFDGTQTVYYKVIAEKSLSMDEVLETLGKLGVRCVYVNAETGIEELTEVTDESLLMESPITYSK